MTYYSTDRKIELDDNNLSLSLSNLENEITVHRSNAELIQEKVLEYKELFNIFIEQLTSNKDATRYIIDIWDRCVHDTTFEQRNDLLKEIKTHIVLFRDNLNEYKNIQDSHGDTGAFIKQNLLPHMKAEFFSLLMNTIKHDFDALDKENTDIEKLKTTSALIDSYSQLTQIRDNIILSCENLITKCAKRCKLKVKFSPHDIDDIKNICVLLCFEILNSYTPTRNTLFTSYMENILVFRYQDEIRKITHSRNIKRVLTSSTSSEYQKEFAQAYTQLVSSTIPKQEYTNENGKMLSQLDLVRSNDSYANEYYENKRIQRVRRILKYIYGSPRYIMQARCELLDRDNPTCYSDILTDQKIFATHYYQQGTEKFKLIYAALKTHFNNEDKIMVEQTIMQAFQDSHYGIKKEHARILLEHFGLCENNELSRYELSDKYNIPIEKIDNIIRRLLSKVFIYKNDFNKAYKLSLYIENRFLRRCDYPLLNNFYSFLKENERAFFRCRYDIKNGVIRDLYDCKKILKLKKSELLALDRIVINKLKFLEPKIYKYAIKLFKATLKTEGKKASPYYKSDMLTLLSPLQFKIFVLKKGIKVANLSAGIPLTQDEILKKLKISKKVYKKEYKKAKIILKANGILNLEKKFKRNFFIQTRYLKFTKHLSPKELASYYGIPLLKYLLIEQRLLTNYKIMSSSKRKDYQQETSEYIKFLQNSKLTYKEKLENALFLATSKRQILFLIHSFGLFEAPIKSTTKLANMFNMALTKACNFRQCAITNFSKYLAIPYLAELSYKKNRNINAPTTPDCLSDLSNSIMHTFEKLELKDKEIFCKNFGLFGYEIQDFQKIAHELNISENDILLSLNSTIQKLYLTYPKDIINQFIISNFTKQFDLQNEELSTIEIQRFLPLFKQSYQKLIISLFGLFDENITSINDLMKTHNISESGLHQQKDIILRTYSAIFNRDITTHDITKLRSKQLEYKQNNISQTKLVDAIKKLSKEEQAFLRFRFLMSATPTLQDCANHFNISAEDALHLSNKAIANFSSHLNTDAKILLKQYLHYDKNLSIACLVESVLCLLADTEQKVLILRLGLFGNKRLTQCEAANALNYKSSSSLAAIEDKIAEKLKDFISPDVLKKILSQKYTKNDFYKRIFSKD